jgi:AmmeMemoRadiSam system protein B
MLVFASITPHPPILVPEVGGKEVEKVKKTKKAMESLAQKLAESEPETLILISPHGLVYPDRMNICGMKNLYGDLSYFGAPQVSMKFENDLEIAKEIDEKANANGVQALLYNNGQETYTLDHGTVVPLYYLTQKLDRPVKLVPIAYSFQKRETHFKFGQIIQSQISNLKSQIALVASGDLSHRLIPQSPAGYSQAGKKFDQKLMELIKKRDIQEILHLDEDLVEEAGECGYRSILILLGVLNKLKYKPEILSYEGPFGVGYLVCNFKIQSSNVK